MSVHFMHTHKCDQMARYICLYLAVYNKTVDLLNCIKIA